MQQGQGGVETGVGGALLGDNVTTVRVRANAALREHRRNSCGRRVVANAAASDAVGPNMK